VDCTQSQKIELPESDILTLFCWIFDDLHQRALRVNSTNEDEPYQIMNIARILRILFVDEHPLVHRCNGIFRLKLQVPDFALHEEATVGSLTPNHLYEHLILKNQISTFGTPLFPNFKTIPKFLSSKLPGIIARHQLSPIEIIKFYSNKVGGVHLNGYLDIENDRKLIEALSVNIFIFGRHPVAMLIKDNVVGQLIECIRPLYNCAKASISPNECYAPESE